MPPRTTKKKSTTESVESRIPPGRTALLRDMAAHGDRSIETAAIIRSTAQAIVGRFHSDNHRLPQFLLQRRGAGPRAASTEAIVDAEIALEALARSYETRAREILDQPIELGTRDAPAAGEFTVDEVVERDAAALEIRTARSTSE